MRVIIFALGLLLLVACAPQMIVATPTETATDAPVPTDTPSPTPTQEVPTVRENAINRNASFQVGCDIIEVVGEAGRRVCKPQGWEWNSKSFTDLSPPPEVEYVPDSQTLEGGHLRLRIDYVAHQSQYCLSQYEYLPDTDFSGNQINYLIKADLELNAPNINTLTRPSIELVLHTDNSGFYTKETHEQLDEKFIEDGRNEFYIWVLDPVPVGLEGGVGVLYQVCFNFRGIQAGDQLLLIHSIGLLQASGGWGLDRELLVQ